MNLRLIRQQEIHVILTFYYETYETNKDSKLKSKLIHLKYEKFILKCNIYLINPLIYHFYSFLTERFKLFNIYFILKPLINKLARSYLLYFPFHYCLCKVFFLTFC